MQRNIISKLKYARAPQTLSEEKQLNFTKVLQYIGQKMK